MLSLEARDRLQRLAAGFGITPHEALRRVSVRLAYAAPGWLGRPLLEAAEFFLTRIAL